MTISSDFSSYTSKELVDLCRQSDLKGYSFKKKHELIDILVKAGIHPGGGRTVPAPENLQTQQQQQQQPNAAGRYYIFNAAWTNVLPYMEDGSAALIIADPASNALGDRWILEGLRILEEERGTFLIRGVPRIPPCVPKTVQATWYTLEDKTKILALRKTAQPAPTMQAKTAEELYRHVLAAAKQSTVILPFAGDGATAKLVQTYPCTLIAMDRDEARVQTLYSILTK